MGDQRRQLPPEVKVEQTQAGGGRCSEGDGDGHGDQQHHPRPPAAGLTQSAGEERPTAVEEDDGAEPGTHQSVAGELQVVAEPVLDHVGGRHDGHAEQQAPPEAAAEHRHVVAVATAVATMLDVAGGLSVPAVVLRVVWHSVAFAAVPAGPRLRRRLVVVGVDGVARALHAPSLAYPLGVGSTWTPWGYRFVKRNNVGFPTSHIAEQTRGSTASKDQLLDRLSRTEVRGASAPVNEDRYCADVPTRISPSGRWHRNAGEPADEECLHQPRRSRRTPEGDLHAKSCGHRCLGTSADRRSVTGQRSPLPLGRPEVRNRLTALLNPLRGHAPPASESGNVSVEPGPGHPRRAAWATRGGRRGPS